MFSQVSVCSGGEGQGEGEGWDRTPPLWTHPRPSLDIPALLTSDIQWSSLEITCSLEDLSPPVLTSSGSYRSRRYASYWNAFLLPPANEVWGKVIVSHVSLYDVMSCLADWSHVPSEGVSVQEGLCSGMHSCIEVQCKSETNTKYCIKNNIIPF